VPFTAHQGGPAAGSAHQTFSEVLRAARDSRDEPERLLQGGGIHPCASCAAKLISGGWDREDRIILREDQITAGFVLTCVAIPPRTARSRSTPSRRST